MRLITIARWAALTGLLVGSVTSPATAQLGFIKKQLKQKVVHTVVDSALSRVAGPGADSGNSGAPATAGAADTSSPSPSSRIGGLLKKRFEKKLLHTSIDSSRSTPAEQPTRPAAAAPKSATRAAPSAAALGSHAAAAPEGPKFDEMVIEITPRSLDRLQKFLATQAAHRNDPEPRGASPLSAAFAGPQLEFVQLSLMTQRVVGYCAVQTGQADAAAVSLYGGSIDTRENFKASEIAALRPRCPQLMALLGSDS